ncbi:4'-phosphopantetheinyl transferase superfamily protein [Mucilaginibacter sp. UR6-11]|uniref:4'-phosphopantetheinyl transferase family protein n=1 Tax=Mucilaginibacter sp. UR6-11 TaxID=1435644 RepID=UPI001E3DC007|nr:4'-phosphopantetheinyl transferase superfamily protein [Mucilaginibacter sp. UR6-11]MCC8425584.1 4'-phosphopantetheinyl transferase superfamily protein [Mucilaginibacter sp. UR6-11]
MIVCCHTEILKPWSDDELQQRLEFIPDRIRQQLLLKKNHLDVQLSVAGNLLILALLKHFGIGLTLVEIVYNDYQRPYFNGGFDFNISHSGNRVIGCATLNGKVGVDIEVMKPVDLDYDDYFTANEQQKIRAAKDPGTEFFKYWTRKEAVLKALGTGVHTPLPDIDVSADELCYNSETYYLTPIDIAAGYHGCIAHTVKQEISVNQLSV